MLLFNSGPIVKPHPFFVPGSKLPTDHTQFLRDVNYGIRLFQIKIMKKSLQEHVFKKIKKSNIALKLNFWWTRQTVSIVPKEEMNRHYTE